MKIDQALQTVERRLADAENKADQKAYAQLHMALRQLRDRDMSAEQLRAIESALGPVLQGQQNPQQLKRRVGGFFKIVMSTLSMVPRGHYMALGLCFGVALGTSVGFVLQGLTGLSGTSAGIGLGLILGVFIGSLLDAKAAAQDRVLKASIV